MDLGSIALILALLILVGLFVARPLLERSTETPHTRPASDAEEHELSSLLAERDRILNALQELDFDNTLGKIPAEDYPGQRAMLLQRGAAVLRRLDELQADQGTAVEDAEARLEAVIAARRADTGRGTAAVAAIGTAPKGNGHGTAVAIGAPDDQIEVLLASRRRARQEKAGGFCPKCGGAVQKSDRFCPKCGAQLA